MKKKLWLVSIKVHHTKLATSHLKILRATTAFRLRYGVMAGLDPSRALIFSLQALQAGLLSREFVMSELPWSMNVGLEKDRIDVERMRDALAWFYRSVNTSHSTDGS